MILEAVYIFEHFLFDKPQTINFGGEYIYDFILDEKKNNIEVKYNKNKKFLPDFFGENISLVSAIVGSNGTGKTSILSLLNKFNDTSKVVFVYNDGSQIPVVENRSGLRDDNGNYTSQKQLNIFYNNKPLENKPDIDIPTIYYTATPSFELNDFYTPLHNIPSSGSTFDDYYFDSIERNVMYLSSEINLKLKKKHQEIPEYDKLHITAKPLRKRDLRNIYGGFKGEGDIAKAQSKALDDLWGRYIFKNKEKDHLTNDGSAFFKDVEVNILSYLVIDATSMKTIFNGTSNISIKNMTVKMDFDKKLSRFLANKVAFIDKYLFERVKKNIAKLDFDGIIKKVKEQSFNKELDQKERYAKDIISAIKSKGIRGKNHEANLGVVNNNISRLLDHHFSSEEFLQFNENVRSILKDLNVPISAPKTNLDNWIIENLDLILKGLKLTFKSLRKNRNEIESNVTEGIELAVKLFSAIQRFMNTAKESLNQKGLTIQGGEIVLDIEYAKSNLFKSLLGEYRSMITCFNKNSVINAQILQFRPSKKLSYGEKSLLNILSTFYDFTLNRYNFLRQKKNYLILLDEADLGFHPQWKQTYISFVVNILPEIFNELFVRKSNQGMTEAEEKNLNPKIQIVLTTHDPLALSDMPNYNVTYIQKLTDKISNILEYNGSKGRPTGSFGANIAELLSHSFFVNDGLIGDFSREKINDVIDWLHSDDKSNAEYNRKVIEIIDEPVVYKKLIELYAEKMESEDLKRLMKQEYLRIASQFKNKFGEDI